MKTAKEWAESVVISGQDYGWGKTNSDAALVVIERLVERVQADARAPLEKEIARLRAENERLNAEHAEYREFVAGARDMRAEEHEQVRKANQ